MNKLILLFSLLLTTHLIHSQCLPQSVDTDQDGICDLLDKDDDNDGILDSSETVCNNTFSNISFYGNAVSSVDNNSISLINSGTLWKTSYSNETFSLPIHLEFVATTNNPQMLGLQPFDGEETPDNWNDKSYKLYTHPNKNIYAKLPNAWSFILGGLDGELVELDIDNAGELTTKIGGKIIYRGTADITDYRLAVSTYNGGAFEGIGLTYGDPNCSRLDIDTDGDNIPNRLDLDSDGDQCVDAFEGTGNFGLNDMDGNGQLLGGVDTDPASPNYGVPIMVDSAGQGAGESIIPNASLIDLRECFCIASNNPVDTDSDGICDAIDICAQVPDNLIGTPCDDGNSNTVNDRWTTTCDCIGTIPCAPGALDTDADGICDKQDMDDDNDGILDKEESICSIVLSDSYGTAIETMNTDSISLADNAAWRGTYFEDTLSLPIHLEFQTDFITSKMVGLLPIGYAENLLTWSDGGYKVYIHENGRIYGKMPSVWAFNLLGAPNQLIEMDLEYDGAVTVKQGGIILYEGFVPINDYKFVVNSTNGGSIKNLAITASNKPCTLIDIDNDSDGIPNRLDLDSDDDKCVDAFEGAADLRLMNMDNVGRLLGNVNTDANSNSFGVPLIAGTGQAPGGSKIKYTVVPDIRECMCIASNNPTDSDGDGVCDVADLCDVISDALIGTPCDDGDNCTTNDKWTANCDCAGTFSDSDGDGICDVLDNCVDFDNTIDIDKDDIPDCIDDCIDIDEDEICDDQQGNVAPDKLKVYTTYRRGFYEQAFDQYIFANTPNAAIYYTLDGTIPSNNSQLYNGTPLSIDSTTILRTIAYTSLDTSRIETHSFLFLDDIIADPTLKTHITEHPIWGAQLKNALMAIPSISLVSDSLLNPEIKISGSMEMLFANKVDNFQSNCGLGEYGNASLRLPKRNMRMYFDAIYGPSSLKESVFEGFENGIAPQEKFDKLDLRSSHESWLFDNKAHPWHKGETYITTKLMDDIMLRGGTTNPHNRFVHVYLDGKYWGQYDLREKFDDNMIAEYLGGENDEYNFISGSKVTVSTFYPAPGVLKDSINTDWEIFVNSSDDYLTWKTMTDENSFFDMMILFMYGFAEAEWNAVGSPSNGKEFVFQSNDADLFFSRGLPLWTNRTYPQHNANGPNNMFIRLFNEGHPDFLQDFSDRASLLLNYDGALTPNTLRDHMDEIAAIIEQSIIGEAAKWSDDGSETPSQWREKIDSFKVNMVDVRRDIVLGQMKKSRIYPNLDPIEFSIPEGLVAANSSLDLTNSNSNGNIYYTLDGTDPRGTGGSINPTAISYTGALTLPQGITQINARIKGQEITYTKNNIALNKPISVSKPTNERPIDVANDGQIWGVYEDSSATRIVNNIDANPWIEIDLETVQNIDVVRFWERSEYAISLDLDNPYVFISDQPFTSEVASELEIDPTVQTFIYEGNAAEVFEIAVNTQGRYVRVMFDKLNLFYCSEFEIFQIDSNPQTKDIWSPMVPQTYYTNQEYTNIVINEIMYNHDGNCAATDSTELDFIELYNKGTKAIDLSGSSFVDGISFEFPYPTILQPGAFLVLAENIQEFAAVYGFTPFDQYEGGLSNDGEKIVLYNSLGIGIDSLTYNNKNPWDEHPDGEGTSLELLHPTLENGNATSWFRSDNSCGTPGQANSRICAPSGPSIVINEINYNSDNDNFDAGDWIELYNPTSATVDLSGWTFYDNGNAFVLPAGTSISQDGYLVLVEDANFFTTAFPTVNSNLLIGDIGFTLSNKGERISLFNENKCLSDYVVYNDKDPWPTTPDGSGTTLTLLDPTLDNSIAPYWKASDELNSDFTNGSPGRSNLCSGKSTTIVTSQINSSTDDAEEKLQDGSVSVTSGDLDLVNDEGVLFTVGMRFQNIAIPQGVEITSAVIEFAADEANTEATNIIIKGEAIDNAASFTTGTNTITNRNTTTNSATWKPDAWQIVGANGSQQKTVDLSNIVQEIIDRPGFVTGNAIAFIMEGTGIRTAESYDGDPNLAPKLLITYTSGSCGVQAKVLLEGFYNAGTQEMHTQLQDKGLLPTLQPFNTAPWNYTGTESASTLPSTAVEWVLVISRNADGTIKDQAAGFIDTDGHLMSVDGNQGIPLGANNQYVSIHTRSHLAILSSNVYTGELYDFTTASTQARGNNQLKLASGKYVLYAGDYDGSGIINNIDFNKWKVQSAQLNQYIPIDGDGNGIINSRDYNLWINNRSKIGEQVIRY